MKWILPSNREINITFKKYKIDFDKPSRSKQQFKIKQFLRKHCAHHILFEEVRIPSTLLKVDFLNLTKNFAIEHQGVAHIQNGFNTFFHNNDRLKYLGSIKRDVEKRKHLERNGFTLIETFPEDLPLTINFFIEKYGIYL